MSVFRNLLMKVSGWLGKPADWSDIRKNCPANSIALYAGHTADYSQYDNLGFTATCVGGYNVFIDGTQYGTTYASGATCTITWSTSGITTGDDITTPSAMKAHKIWVIPATEGNDITAFQCQNSRWDSGLLWAHFNLTNEITLTECFAVSYYSSGYNELLQAITAKNNKIKLSSANYFDGFVNTTVEYLPIFESNYNHSTNFSFGYVKVAPKLKFKSTGLVGMFYGSSFDKLGNYDYSDVINMQDYITYNTSLQCDLLDVRSATGLKGIGIYGDASRVMGGFKGLRVSNEAPFNDVTPPQINVSYTGMDRTALVQLFNDLPTVSDGQIINITGCTGSENLTDEEISIAENKGWTVAGGPAFQVYATYSGASVGDTIKLNDGMATSAQVWSAYPSDTALTGNYTQTKTVTAVDGDLLECEKPTETSYNATITTDETSNIDTVDNTTIQTVAITLDQTATIETSANITTSNNDTVITDGSYHLFNLTVPTGMTPIIESSGISYQTSDMPLFLKKNSGVGLLLKDGNNAYYRNSLIITKDYDLHYQQINFSYPVGATVTCKVNNVAQSNLTPYVYAGDIVSWTCDNAGTITTGSYTVKYSSKDGNVQTITIS